MPKDQAAKLFAGVGEYYIDKGMLDNSIDSFRDAISMDDKNVAGHMGLSDALTRKGNDLLVKDQYETAKTYFQEALKNNPKNAAAYSGLGSAYADLNQNAEAIASYEKSLAGDKTLTEIYTPLGILYYQSGEIAKADDMLTKALATSGGTAETQFFVGMIRYSQNRHRPIPDELTRSHVPGCLRALEYKAELNIRRTIAVAVKIHIAKLVGRDTMEDYPGNHRCKFLRGPAMDMNAAAAVQLHSLRIEAVRIVPFAHFWRVNRGLIVNCSTELGRHSGVPHGRKA